MEQIYTPKQDYKVLVRCFTYNQSKYIEDALNGFAMQQTNFPFVCLVMDDCSTDGEQEVIKAWIERECDMEKAECVEIELSNIILVPHSSNLNCTFALYLLKQNLYGTGKKMPLVAPWRNHCEYEAICEGDDYWTQPYKLQRQADFLDKNTEYGLCYAQCRYYYQERGELSDYVWGGPNVLFEEFLHANTVPTLTIMYRVLTEFDYQKNIKPDLKGWPMGDHPRYLYYSHESKIMFAPDEMGVYRVLDNSAYHGNYSHKKYFSEKASEMVLYFAELYGHSTTQIIENKYRKLFTLACVYREEKDVASTFKLIKKKRLSDYVKRYLYKVLYSPRINKIRRLS